MNPLSASRVASLFARDLWNVHKGCILPGSHPHGVGRTLLWTFGIFVVSIVYFFLYFSPVTLHDAAHYAISGISLMRDHQDLLYPYFPQSSDGLGPAYEKLQNNTIIFNARTNYPSKLYTAIYGVICLFADNMRLEYLQWISLFSFFTGNIFLYLIGSRFFRGLDLLFFIIAVIFMPVMREVVNPGSDGIAATASLALLWLCLCWRVNPFVLGLYAGLFAHLRGQMLFLLAVLPFLYTTAIDRAFFRRVLVPMTFGFAITYGAMAVLFDVMIKSSPSSNPVGFYVEHFKNCFDFHIHTALNKWVTSFVALFDKSQLFVYATLAIPCAFWRNTSLQKNLSLAAVLYVVLPMILYAFDRYAPSQPRYYIFAIPLIALSVFLEIKSIVANSKFTVPSRLVYFVLASIVFSAWYTTHGMSFEALDAKYITSKARFLDFDGVQETLAAHFKEDDIVIVNHSLPTGLSRLHNVIYVPPFKQFQEGDNHKIKGIIFVFSDTPPNDFFKPKDWMQGDALPVMIADLKGVKFQQIYAKTSDVILPNGNLFESVHFYIYEKVGAI